MSKLVPPKIYTCAEWGAKPVKVAFIPKPAEGIVTHHTAGPNVTPLPDPERELARCFKLARQIQAYHIEENGWADSGQHFTITRSGIILEGRHGTLRQAMRGRCVRGAHCGVGPVNGTHFGAEWEGRYDGVFAVTDEQWKSGVELYAWLATWGRFDTQNTFPHKKYKATACPGKLADHLERLRREAHDLKLRILAQDE